MSISPIFCVKPNVRGAQGQEDDDRIAVSVAGTKAVEIDLITPFTDGHLVFERPLGQAARGN